jgi:hypothetical protein
LEIRKGFGEEGNRMNKECVCCEWYDGEGISESRGFCDLKEIYVIAKHYCSNWMKRKECENGEEEVKDEQNY